MADFQAYKWFIDNLVGVAQHNGQSRRLPEEEKNPSEKDLQLRSLLARLQPSERTLIADLMNETRCRAVHDVAGFLEWATAEARLSIVLHSETIPSSPYASMHHDFICRFDGENWPDSGKDVMQ